MIFLYNFFSKIQCNFKPKTINKILNNIFNKAPFHIAIEKGNIELVKYLLSVENIDVNIHYRIFNIKVFFI